MPLFFIPSPPSTLTSATSRDTHKDIRPFYRGSDSVILADWPFQLCLSARLELVCIHPDRPRHTETNAGNVSRSVRKVATDVHADAAQTKLARARRV